MVNNNVQHLLRIISSDTTATTQQQAAYKNHRHHLDIITQSTLQHFNQYINTMKRGRFISEVADVVNANVSCLKRMRRP
uniref:Uncharacterized protein n=1 Tax=Panagrolaimus sp. ES5 TaxID=591445 RepID=A0AC34GKB4_9BILA